MNEPVNQDRLREEVYHLTESCLRGEISPEDLAHLEKLLNGGADALGHYLEYISQSAALSVWATALADSECDGPPLKPEAAPMATISTKQERSIPLSFESDSLIESPAIPPTGFRSSTTSPFHEPSGFLSGGWRSTGGFVLGVVVAAIAFGAWMLPHGFQDRDGIIADNRSQASEAAIALSVAYLTSNTGCAWGNESLKLQTVGSSVGLGDEIALQEGIAEFRLANGVYVSVEGPAGMVLTSPDSLVLQYGKITTHIPWPVTEFRILAGACRLVASDAEFGVCVTGGRVDTHVFSGEVLATNALLFDQEPGDGDSDQLASSSPSRDTFGKAVISQGRALTLLNQNSVMKVSRWDKAAPSLFATKLTMAGPLPISTAYTDAVLASRPRGYWRFESGRNGVVVSEVPGVSDLSIVGDLRLSGLGGNRVADFHPGSDCYLVSREPLDALAKTDYSTEVWVKPSHVHCGAVLGLCATDPVTLREKNAFLLELESSGSQQVRSSYSLAHPCTFRYLHRDPPERNYKLGTSCFSKRPYSIRRWQHIVTVKKGEQMELYVDGKLSATARDSTFLAPGLHLIVGRQEAVGSPFQFIGQLDELALYSRALSQEEIQAHYKSIDWAEAKQSASEPRDF